MEKNDLSQIGWLEIFSSYAPGKPGAKCKLPPDLSSDDGEFTAPTPTKDIYIVDQIENEELDKKVLKRKRKEAKKPPAPRKRTVILDDVSLNYQVDENLPIHGFEYTSKEEDNARFLRKLATISMVSEKHGNRIPPQVQVLRYIDNLTPEAGPEWYENALKQLADTSTRYPAQPVLSRKYLANFLREPRDKERECVHPNCKSVEMGGFRCRELLMPRELDLHPTIRGWCYICHLYESNRLYWENRNPPPNKNKKGVQVFCVHFFTVFTDTIGEYRLDKTIRGDEDTTGVFGPFPIFNVNNYVKIGVGGGKCGWKENDALVFRLTSKVSAQSGSSPITQRGEAKF